MANDTEIVLNPVLVPGGDEMDATLIVAGANAGAKRQRVALGDDNGDLFTATLTGPVVALDVAVQSAALPTNAATETTLLTRATEATLALVKAKTDNLDVLLSTRASEATLATRLADATFTARINTLGQKAMAASTPVVIASDQSTLPIRYADTPQLDAFSRARVSQPYAIFSSKLLLDNQPLIWDDQQVSGAGTTSTYASATASVTLLAAGATAGRRVRQTFRRFNYQPGKALRHGEPVLTPSGWLKIEDVKIGDVVFDGLGHATKVIGVYPQGVREIYRMTFDDGTHVDCDGEHLWKTMHRNNRTYPGSNYGEIRVLTTRQMLEEYGEEPPSFARWRIPASPVLVMDDQPVTIDPYTLGAILGDGDIAKGGGVGFTSADPEIVANLKAEVHQHKGDGKGNCYHYGLLKLGHFIRDLGLAGTTCYTKFVPDIYKYNSIDVRRGMLQGLMDTDGTVDKGDGTADYTTVSHRLAEDVAYLVRSLGGQAKIKTRTTKYTNSNGDRVKGGLSYRIRVILSECPFRLGRKAFYWKPRTRISFDRYVHSIKPIGEGEATCIRVASEDHTFLTRNHIVTHNSQLVLMTGVLAMTGAGNAVIKRRLGLYDDANGFWFEYGGSTMNVALRTSTSGAPVDTLVAQGSWNLDKLDGTGASGVTLDPAQDQIFVIDFQWLGTGRIRYGFDIAGIIIYCHQLTPANAQNLVSISSPNLPVRYEIISAGGGAGTATMTQICSTVVSEGGSDRIGFPFTVATQTEVTSGNDSNVYGLIAMQLQTGKFAASVIVDALSAISTTANASFLVSLYINPTIAGAAPVYTNLANSAIKYALLVAANLITLGTQIYSVIIASNRSGGASIAPSEDRLSIGSSIAGVSDTLVLAVQPIPAQGATKFLAAINWREVV